MERFICIASVVTSTKIPRDDDGVDRLNHRYTVLMLIFCAVFIAMKSYTGESIQCWSPAYFNDNHVDYVAKMCWVSNTYYLSLDEKHFPEPEAPRDRIVYYQWVPIMLLCQAALFYLPRSVWRLLNTKSGIHINSLVNNAVDLQDDTLRTTRDKNLNLIAQNLDHYLGGTQRKRKGCYNKCAKLFSRYCCTFIGRRFGNYLIATYLLVKMLYLCNVLGQLALLNSVLGNNYYIYGYEVLIKLLGQEEFTQSKIFPLVTICDFHLRKLGNIHRHTVQCVLPFNFFYDKLYIFIWFWFVFVAMATLISFFDWLLRFACRADRLRYVRHHLKSQGLRKKQDSLTRSRDRTSDKQKTFIDEHLRQDGVFIIRMVDDNCSDLVAAEIVGEMWLLYSGRLTIKEPETESVSDCEYP